VSESFSPSTSRRPITSGSNIGEAQVTRAEAIAAWTELKELDVPKDYAPWVKTRAKRKGESR